MPKFKMPRFTIQTLTVPTLIAETNGRAPVPSQRALVNLSPANQQQAVMLTLAIPRPPQVFPAGSIVMTSVDDGGVRVLTPGQFNTLFEVAPEGGGKYRMVCPNLTQITPTTGQLIITTNSDGSINTGSAGSHAILTNSVTGEQRVVSLVDIGQNFE